MRITAQERKDRLEKAAGGPDKAGQLRMLYEASKATGTPYMRLAGDGLTKEQAFRMTALKAGFSQEAIGLFLLSA